jgi:hypothetical protein
MEEWLGFALQETSLMENTVTVEPKGVSIPSGDPPAWLVRIWNHHGKAKEIVVDMGVWLPEYPDLLRLIENYPGVDAYPHKECLLPDGVTPAACEIMIKPRTLEALRALAAARSGPKTHGRQVTINRYRIDLRTITGVMLVTTSVANLADACRLWLADLKSERKATARRKVRILLERAVGIRGEEIAAYDPILKRQILDALSPKRVTTERAECGN